MTIVLTGGAGFIGSTLARELLGTGHTVVVIDRRAPLFTHEHLYFINCDLVTSSLPYNVLERTDAVIHLVGTTIARKWTDQVKEDIRHSRVESTKRVVESIMGATNRPPVFICASAIGFYGDTGEEVANEQSAHGEGFLAEVVAEWEAEARKATEAGVRVVLLRTAPVLGNGGIIDMVTKTARFGFLMSITKKDFWFSWIHQSDIVRAYLFALETNTLQGVVNASAPEPVQWSVFMSTIAHALKRRIIGTVPEYIAKKMFGGFFDEMTKSTQVLPGRLIDKGFVFQYSTLQSAIDSLIPHEKNR